MRRSYTRIVEPSVTLQRVDDMQPGGPHCGCIDTDRVFDALGEGGVEELALILELIPAFEQEDRSVLDDLAASVDYWLEALARRGALAG